MRKFKLTNSKDGIKRIDFKITYRLDLDELTTILAIKILTSGLEIKGLWISDYESIVEKEMSPSEVSSTIRESLYAGENVLPDSETIHADLLEWCMKQVKKIVEE